MKREAKLDSLGRLVVPSDILKELKWDKSTKDIAQYVIVEMVDNTIVVTKDTENRCDCGCKLKDRYNYCPDCGRKVK